ncbi:MAG: HAD-IC family P-type ATPase [Acidimicrobiales bacterium]|jgi:cation-transporting ATPase E|nr:HAD-IC family P-type ATPase [Acidimicrobiales bacterium]
MTATVGGSAELAGLTTEEVAARRADGRTNDVEDPTSRTVADIVRSNVLTPFNFLLGSLLVVILAVREYRDALFGIVLVLNAVIGIVQETRAKRSLDRLALLNAPHALVRRDGAIVEIPSKELVEDDLVELRLGDQIAVDGLVLEGSGLEIDESLLTGEADPVPKSVGDEVLSGSFVVAGAGAIRTTGVGVDAYAFKLASEARRFSLVNSELRDGINRVIKMVSWLMIPTAILLVTAQLSADVSVTEAVQGSVAGLVAMVPEGLVLLTSIAFAVGATRLARRKVLTQELAAIEGLARVDVICLDKTGTLTEGSLSLATVEHLGHHDDTSTDAGSVLAALGATDDHPNPSLAAIVAHHDHPPAWSTTEVVPFSSARKWSAAAFADHGAWLLGAPDILLTRAGDDVATTAGGRLDHYARRGRRVLLLASAPGGLTGEDLPPVLDPVALVVLDERLRDSAPDTIAYFADQGVAVKVISGDSPVTVGAVAERVGVPGAEHPVDARQLPDDPDELADVMDRNAVFGRVTPQQKRAMVHALQRRGHTVAMTGDGVNDTLALKDADIGVAMGAGSAAARAVARFVLLDDDFAVFPSVVAEGRRVIANVERVANLFLTKTFYAMALALAVGVGRLPFPFLPRHFTIISALTIGIPGFFLALAPNPRLARPGFLRRVLRFAVPAGVVAAIATFGAYLIARDGSDADLAEARTVAVIVLFVVALWVLAFLSRPLTSWRGGLVVAMAVLFVGALAIPWFRDYFDLVLPDAEGIAAAVGVGAVAGGLLQIGWQLSGWAPPPADDHTTDPG